MNNQNCSSSMRLKISCSSLFRLCCFVVILSLGSLANIANALEVRAALDRTPIFLDESVKLILTAEGKTQVDGNPDLTPLRKDFEIMGQSVQTRIKVDNNVQHIVQNWVIEIKPKRLGITEVPAVSLGSYQTLPVALEVKAYTGNVLSAGDDIFIEIEVTPENPYVQSQVTYVVRVFYAVDVPEGTLSDPIVTSASVERLGQERRYQAQRAGREYKVFERRYSIFPEQSGLMEITPVEFNGVVKRINRTTLKTEYTRERISSNSVRIVVRPKPSSFSGNTWLPARDLRITDSWDGTLPKFQVGKPETRIITIKAVGLRALQLLSPTYEENKLTRIYSTNPVLNTRQTYEWTMGQRDEEFVIIPQDTIALEIPEFKVVWWDVDEDREKVASLPKISVASFQSTGTPATTESASLAPLNADSTDSSTVSTGSNTLWRFMSIGLLVAWILTLIIWYVSHKSRRFRSESNLHDSDQIEQTARQLSGEIQRACRQDNATAVSHALLKWAQLEWSDYPPRNLPELGYKLGSEELLVALQNLDRAIYSGEADSWNGGELLWKTFSSVRKSIVRKSGKKRWNQIMSKPHRALDELWLENESS